MSHDVQGLLAEVDRLRDHICQPTEAACTQPRCRLAAALRSTPRADVDEAIIEAAWEVDLATASGAPLDVLDAALDNLHDALMRLPVQPQFTRRETGGARG